MSNAVEDINPYAGDSRDKRAQVEDMFDGIAPSYDMMNRLMSLGLDRLWLRSLVGAARRCDSVRHAVDMATGTGDVAFALAKAMPGVAVTGLDISEGMLERARDKALTSPAAQRLTFLAADCTATPLPDAGADLITAAYGVRNFADIAAGYREMHRLLRPGGSIAILELSAPASPLMRLPYRLYTRAIIPFAGKIFAGDGKAYSYLLDSVDAVPARKEMCAIITAAGFEQARWKTLFPGTCTLYTARKPISNT